jgi:hypothetical protein
MILCMNKKILDGLDKIDSGIKSSFTRTYNKVHGGANGFTKVAGGKRGNKGLVGESSDSGENDSDLQDENTMLDEEKLAEIKKAK